MIQRPVTWWAGSASSCLGAGSRRSRVPALGAMRPVLAAPLPREGPVAATGRGTYRRWPTCPAGTSLHITNTCLAIKKKESTATSTTRTVPGDRLTLTEADRTQRPSRLSDLRPPCDPPFAQSEELTRACLVGSSHFLSNLLLPRWICHQTPSTRAETERFPGPSFGYIRKVIYPTVKPPEQISTLCLSQPHTQPCVCVPVYSFAAQSSPSD
jgi:hypothetical protein